MSYRLAHYINCSCCLTANASSMLDVIVSIPKSCPVTHSDFYRPWTICCALPYCTTCWITWFWKLAAWESNRDCPSSVDNSGRDFQLYSCEPGSPDYWTVLCKENGNEQLDVRYHTVYRNPLPTPNQTNKPGDFRDCPVSPGSRRWTQK